MIEVGTFPADASSTADETGKDEQFRQSDGIDDAPLGNVLTFLVLNERCDTPTADEIEKDGLRRQGVLDGVDPIDAALSSLPKGSGSCEVADSGVETAASDATDAASDGATEVVAQILGSFVDGI